MTVYAKGVSQDFAAVILNASFGPASRWNSTPSS